MDKKDLQDGLTEFMKQRQKVAVFPAKVTAVSEDPPTIDVVDIQGNEFFNVRLRADATDTPGVLIIPQVDSWVLIGNIGNSENAYCALQYSEVDKVYINADDATEVYVDDELIRLGGGKVEPAVIGETLNGNLEALLNQLDTLLTNLQTFTTTQAAASVGTLAPLAPGYTTLTPQLTSVQSSLASINGQLDTHLSETVKVAP